MPLDYFRKTDIAQSRGSVAAQTSPAGQAADPELLHQDKQTRQGRDRRGETGNRLQENKEINSCP